MAMGRQPQRNRGQEGDNKSKMGARGRQQQMRATETAQSGATTTQLNNTLGATTQWARGDKYREIGGQEGNNHREIGGKKATTTDGATETIEMGATITQWGCQQQHNQRHRREMGDMSGATRSQSGATSTAQSGATEKSNRVIGNNIWTNGRQQQQWGPQELMKQLQKL